MALKIKPRNTENISSQYYCIHSIQKLNSKFNTNVFTSTIPISQLLKNRDVLLVDDLKGDARWGMNKIIQRNISSKRVNEIKTEYLGAANRLIKFFPSITVILLPKTNGEPIQHYSQSKNDFDSIKGVKVVKEYESENDEIRYDYPISLSWDKNEISALVIDGQHRVSAIRSFYDGKNESSYQDISIPVTFVVFKNSADIDLIQATRALFIDVNNTPRLVSEEKLIFIDDRNIHRRLTAKIFGANNPGDNSEDYYQKMLHQDDYLLNDITFINRYLIEESGKDDEEARGFLSNHRNLFPWEISNIMTIHRNIIGNIVLKYRDIDKTRDIRSICHELNNSILEEIECKESVEELNEYEINKIQDRLIKSGLSLYEVEIFATLIQLKKRNLEEIQEAEGEFFVGTIADDKEEQDRKDFIAILQNVYNQDCSKDSTFEFSAETISQALSEKSFSYITLLTFVYNNLWFTTDIKESILSHQNDDRKLIFNFIVTTHESLKIESNIRRRTDKVEKQISNFLKEYEINGTVRSKILRDWGKALEDNQRNNVLRTVVGQEMLFTYLLSQASKVGLIDVEAEVEMINSLGRQEFFDSAYTVELNFPHELNFGIIDINPWSEIIMKGDSMKPGITNATKGASLISMYKNKVTNRLDAGTNLRVLDKLQKSYGVEIMNSVANNDKDKIFAMYQVSQDNFQLDRYLTPNEIEIITEEFSSADTMTNRSVAVLSKLYGGIAFEQVINHFMEKLS